MRLFSSVFFIKSFANRFFFNIFYENFCFPQLFFLLEISLSFSNTFFHFFYIFFIFFRYFFFYFFHNFFFYFFQIFVNFSWLRSILFLKMLKFYDVKIFGKFVFPIFLNLFLSWFFFEFPQNP